MSESFAQVPPFTLVTTVLNESSRLDNTIADIEAQTLKPDEIIITDAGSKDGTYERLLRWKQESNMHIVVLQMPKCNIAQGRNLAIRTAKNELIASTDFGCRYHPKWLESLMTPFAKPDVKVTGGNFFVVEEDIVTVPAKAAYIIANGYHNDMNAHFLPSSRSIAYYRSVWEDIGGYEEWLTLAADDYTFALLIKKKGYKIHLVKEPYVYWGRHKTGIAYGKEAFRYGLGDGEAHVNLRNFISNAIETLMRYALLVILLAVTFGVITNVLHWSWYVVAVPFLFGLRSYKSSFDSWLKYRSKKYGLEVLLYSFYLIELTRWYYFKGYIKGRFFATQYQKEQAILLQKRLNA